MNNIISIEVGLVLALIVVETITLFILILHIKRLDDHTEKLDEHILKLDDHTNKMDKNIRKVEKHMELVKEKLLDKK